MCSFSRTHAQGSQTMLQEGVVPSTSETSFPMQTPFYRQNAFSISLAFYFTLWAACNTLAWGSQKGERGKCRMSPSKCQGGQCRAAGPETLPREAPWCGRGGYELSLIWFLLMLEAKGLSYCILSRCLTQNQIIKCRDSRLFSVLLASFLASP